MKIAPLMWIFLQFINYWNICSYYLLINIIIPDYFTSYLKQIYDTVNSSVLKQLGINLQVKFDISEAVSDQNLIKN
jgi:hypothetical protein